MELSEAIEILKENRDVAKQRADSLEKNNLTDFLDIQYKMDKKDYEAIDTVLAELDRQNEEIKNYQNTIEVIEDLGRKKIGEIVEKALKGEE